MTKNYNLLKLMVKNKKTYTKMGHKKRLFDCYKCKINEIFLSEK